MRLALIRIKRRAGEGAAEVSRRETLLEGAALRVGRGADCDVQLQDVAIDYHHATLRAEGGALVIEAVGDAAVTVDGRSVRRETLAPGARAAIGAFVLAVETAPAHADFAIAVEAAEDVVRRPARQPQTLAQALPSRRRLAWLLALPLVALTFAWPLWEALKAEAPPPGAVVVTGPTDRAEIASHPMVAAWTSGPMSRAHEMLGEDCASCHLRPFEMTTNAACLACHAETGRHAGYRPEAAQPLRAGRVIGLGPDTPPVAGLDPAHLPLLAGMDDLRCASCHKEHEGGTAPIERASGLCVDCHGATEALHAVAPRSALRPVADFGSAHPEFRVTGAVLPGGGSAGLRFPHDVHLTGRVLAPMPGRPADMFANPPEGWVVTPTAAGPRLRSPEGRMFTEEGRADLGCADCHVAEAGGMLMRPVEMERDCGWCHQLRIDTLTVARAVPHANPFEVSEIVRDYYRARALEGGVQRDDAPAFARRPGGTVFRSTGDDGDVPMREAMAWAAAEAEKHLERVFRPGAVTTTGGVETYEVGQGLCSYCHRAERDEASAAGWRVIPARLQRHWMPMARFDHGPHAAMDCVACHAATTSKTAEDVLMPKIGLCRDCHKGEATSAPSASSECVACHGFHNDAYGPTSPAHAAAWRGQTRDRERARPGERTAAAGD